MKKIIIISLLLTVFLCSCGKKEVLQKPEVEQLRSICDLATLKCYYNNVAKSTKKKGSGIAHWGESDRSFWIEYSGTVKIGIDFSKVKMSVSGDDVNITIPKAKILELEADEMTLNEDSYLATEDSWFNKNKITAKDQTKAIAKAQKKMEETVSKNNSIFVQAQSRAKKLIENYIRKIGDATGQTFKIKWEYVDSDDSEPTPARTPEDSGKEE